jgi:hypothetical protein
MNKRSAFFAEAFAAVSDFRDALQDAIRIAARFRKDGCGIARVSVTPVWGRRTEAG